MRVTGKSWTSDSFVRAIDKPEREIDLSEAALSIALDEYPDLEPGQYLLEIDRLGQGLLQNLTGGLRVEHLIYRLGKYLFGQLGFRPNKREFYDPRNCYLHEVLERRMGHPLTLSILYMEIGRRAGLILQGVSLPGYFLVKYLGRGRQILIDPFDGGRVLHEADCGSILKRLTRGTIPFRPEFLSAVGNRVILTRLLTALKECLLRRGSYPAALQAIDKILILIPESAVDIRDRGMAHYYLGDYRRAAEDFRFYLTSVPDAPDAEEIERNLARATRRIRGHA